ncbi:MAG: hypothetical protein ACFE0J_07315 [Elainellaceae cyanobacterium]
MARRIGSYNRQISPDEQKVYDHLLHWIELESPDRMIQRFRSLFIEGHSYSDPEIAAALDRVTASHVATEDFRYVLNRCCHILINRWQARPQLQLSIPDLIDQFESVPDAPTVGHLRYRSTRRLRELVKNFTDTEQYLKLKRLAQVLSEASDLGANSGNYPLGTLIRRYPYLYEHCLLGDDSTTEQKSTVKQIQSHVRRQFEIDLSKYVTYQTRLSQLAVQPDSRSAQRLIYPIPNPTLLPDRDLNRAIKHYVGRVEGGRTYRDLALNFITHTDHQVRSYSKFKRDLYDYMTSGIDPSYGNRQFNKLLCEHLQNTLPESDDQGVNDFLLVRTCAQLLNFLIVDSLQQPQHFVFVDLLSNLGPILTTGLFLKVILLCRKVRPCLERRFSILFSHYEEYAQSTVHWLVEALEMLNVALSAHFGRLNVSFIA